MKKVLFTMIAAIVCCLVLSSCGDKEFDKSMEYLNSLEAQVNNCTTKDQWIEFYIEFTKEVNGNPERYENPAVGLYKSAGNRNSVMIKTSEVAALGLKKEIELGIEIGTEMEEINKYIKRKVQAE